MFIAKGRLGVIDAALIRWLSSLKRSGDHLGILVSESIFNQVLPQSNLELFLSEISILDYIISDWSKTISLANETKVNFRMPRLVNLPEQELINYSIGHICKSRPLKEINFTASKMATLEMLLNLYGPHAPRKHRVGIVSGSFDLIHPGHVYLIKKAKDLVDRLVVLAMTSDSIRQQAKNRNGDRPIYSESDRVEVLASLKSVDHILLFDDLDCLSLLKKFCPDIYFKNVHDQARAVVIREANVVNNSGGQTVYLEDVPGKSSSTAIVACIRSQFSEINAC